MEVNLNNKKYFKENNLWYGINKNDKKYKISSLKLIKELEQNHHFENQELKSSGLGDLISKVTKTLGIEECDGCEERKKKLNKRFSWLKQTRELTEDEKEFIIDLNKRTTMKSTESQRLFDLYNEITKSKLQRCICGGLHRTIISRMLKFTK
jgi:hypothetical protein